MSDPTKYRHIPDLMFCDGVPCDDEGYPLAACPDCGKLSLNDNTDVCLNIDCPINVDPTGGRAMSGRGEPETVARLRRFAAENMALESRIIEAQDAESIVAYIDATRAERTIVTDAMVDRAARVLYEGESHVRTWDTADGLMRQAFRVLTRRALVAALGGAA